MNRALNGDTRIYLGIIHGAPEADGESLGSADGSPAVVASWYLDSLEGDGTEVRDTLQYGRNTGSHEFAHTIGSPHAAYLKDGKYYVICSDSSNPRDPRDARRATSVEREYPYKFDGPSGGVRYTLFVAPIGDLMATTDQQIWGVDTRFVTRYGLNALLSDLRRQQLAALDPSEVFSIMSYCRSTGSVEFQWIDAYNHPLFIDAINDVDWSEGPQPSDGSFWEFFSGTWTSDGGQTDEASVRVAPTLRLRPTSTPVEPSGTGDYVLELLDDDAAVLKSVRFAASVAVGDVGPQGDAEPLSERWVVSVKNPPDYASYRIQRRSEVIATVERSSTAPAVAVTAPTAGQVLSADTMEFTWTGSDADGDTLSYTVQYSIDGGVNYKTIALGHNSTRLLRDRRSLAGSARARIRVIASDGARSTTAESAVFTVAASPPEVFISSPGDGSLLAGPQTLVLQAAAYDPEDGAVGASSIQWSSSLDGQLGMGGLVEVATADLSVGTHVLTATATDSSAATGSASVTVAVKRNNTAPSALDDIVYTSGRGSAVTADVAANDSDPDGDLDSYTIAVLVRPSAGTASAHGSAGEGHTITYSPAGGYDALIYSVCDLAGQCTTAELAVVAPPDG